MSAAEPKKSEEVSEEVVAPVTEGEAAVASAEGAEGDDKKASYAKKRKAKRQIQRAQVHVQCTYNNTMVSVSDLGGGILGWSSSGLMGFKGAKKSTPYAATQVAGNVCDKVEKYGIRELEVFVKGVGSGREAAVRAFANKGYAITSIKDITPIPHNGCRARKPRRV
ncbi:30S ribosomal protein S11 [Patescibacteria group bacterium]|nr:MAG: 30S ribosomal protein S11 [Patescibacteria group bacterium]